MNYNFYLFKIFWDIKLSSFSDNNRSITTHYALYFNLGVWLRIKLAVKNYAQNMIYYLNSQVVCNNLGLIFYQM